MEVVLVAGAPVMLRLTRPTQWTKGFISAAPVLVAGHADDLYDVSLLLRCALTVAVFIAAAGAGYAFNDVLDRQADEESRTRRGRPVASGEVGSGRALRFSAWLASAATAAAAVASPAAGGWICAYLLLTVAYSAYLKRKPFLGVMTIAALFTIRFVGGAVMCHQPCPIYWSLTVFLCASTVAFGKRAARGLGEDSSAFLLMGARVCCLLSIAAYCISIMAFASPDIYRFVSVGSFSIAIIRVVASSRTPKMREPELFVWMDKIVGGSTASTILLLAASSY